MIDMNKYIENKKIVINSELKERLSNYFLMQSIMQKELKKEEIPIVFLKIFCSFIQFKVWQIIYRYYPGLEKYSCKLNEDDT